MRESQKREIDEAEAQLQRIKAAIKKDSRDLQVIRSHTEVANTTLEKLDRQHAIRMHQLQQEYDNLEHGLTANAETLRRAIDLLLEERKTLLASIETAKTDIAKLDKQHTDMQQSYEAEKSECEQELIRLQGLLDTKRGQIPRVEAQIEQVQKKLDFIQKQLADGEQAFTDRSVELKRIINDLEKTVRQLGERAREYETGMQFTRAADAERTIELDKHEANLLSRERRLLQDQQDFEHRKKRFHQLKELSQ
jgi:exonuclease VII small subunit